ncbi:MAG: bifunctional metallophosphatase/5'-nucleotidase, partial [Bacteroidales bacterium]|nr:bifunctional metallophosphatase/5'-nucleotidase [Bacteroidales bacterium]
MHIFKRPYFFVAIAIAFLLQISLHSYAQDENVVCIVTVNDQHGNIDNYPQFAAALDTLRTFYPNMLVISAGDNRTGHPVNDRYPQISYPITALMNETGFCLTALGNHEFDSGVDGLKNVIGWSKFDYVCANAFFDNSLNINVSPYKIIEIDGLKLAFIGGIQLGSNGLPDFHPMLAEGVSFKPIQEVLPQYMFLANECNATFLISHCGIEADFELAKDFPQLNAIFGGHSHRRIEKTKTIGNTLITQTGKNLNFISISVFYFKNGKVDEITQQTFPIKNFQGRSPKIQAMVDEFSGIEIFSKVVGNNKTATSEKEELGCLITDAIREYSKSDIA